MKAIKNLCLFCFLIFGILMQSEIFQDQLWNFSTAYFTSSRYEVASEDMSQFLKDVSETATENDVHIFSQSMKSIINTFQHFIFMAMIK